MEYKKLLLITIVVLALGAYVLPINEWVTAQSNEDESQEESEATTEEEEEQATEVEEQDEQIEAEDNEDKLKDNDPDANNGNGNDEVDDEDPDGNPNNREGTPGTERCLERSNGNCANSPVHDGYGDTSEDDADED